MCEPMPSCPACRVAFGERVKGPYHAGFSDLAALYCDRCGRTRTVDWYGPGYPAEFRQVAPWSLSKEQKEVLESRIEPCECGGRFRFDAEPRCPWCHVTLRGLLIDPIYFLDIR